MNNTTNVNPALSKRTKTAISQDSKTEKLANNTSSLKLHTLNRAWRTIGTTFCWAIFGIYTPLLNVIALFIFILPCSKERKRQWIRTTIRHSCLLYLHTMKALGLLTYSFTPKKTIETKGKLIIANHPCLLDALFILGMSPNLCCIAKEELWKNPFTALLVRMADYINNGSENLIQHAQARLNRGENILIFPEGTRNLYDDQLDFKRGAANIAILTNCDIVPIVIRCHPRFMQKGDHWYSTPNKAPHLSFSTLETIKIKDHTNNNSPKTLQYRKLTAFLKHLYQPLLSHKNLRK